MEYVEVHILEFAVKGEEVPIAAVYHVRIDGRDFPINTVDPTGAMLLEKVGRRPCAFELIEELVHNDNHVIEPEERVNLRKKGLKGFITAEKELVTIFINGPGYKIERGERTVAEILDKVKETTEGYVLLEEKQGPPIPLPPDRPVKVEGCEVFHTQPQSGGSS